MYQDGGAGKKEVGARKKSKSSKKSNSSKSKSSKTFEQNRENQENKIAEITNEWMGEGHPYNKKINQKIGDALYGPNTKPKLPSPKKDTNNITIQIEAFAGKVLFQQTFNKNITIKEMKEQVKDELQKKNKEILLYDVYFYNGKREEITRNESDTLEKLFQGVDYPVIAVAYNLSTELREIEIESDYYVLFFGGPEEAKEFVEQMYDNDIMEIDLGDDYKKVDLSYVPKFIDEYIKTHSDSEENYMMITTTNGLFDVLEMIQYVGMNLGHCYMVNKVTTTHKGGITVIDISVS